MSDIYIEDMRKVLDRLSGIPGWKVERADLVILLNCACNAINELDGRLKALEKTTAQSGDIEP